MRPYILAASIASLLAPLMPAAAAHVSTGYTMRATNMRAGPDTDYPVVRYIPRNREVDVFGCLHDWSWCDVGYRNDRGWVAASLLSADYRGRRQRLGSVAPYIGIGVLAFMFGNYWDDYYRSRPFYSDRTRWERHYHDTYRPQARPRPSASPAMRLPDRRQVQPDRRIEQRVPDVRPNTPAVAPHSGNMPPKVGQQLGAGHPDGGHANMPNRTITAPPGDRQGSGGGPKAAAKPDKARDVDRKDKEKGRH